MRAGRYLAPMNILKDLYDPEINFSIVTLWHGMAVKLGDRLNGFKAETSVREWDEAEAWLKVQAIIHFPESRFAMMYGDGLSRQEAAARLHAIAEAGMQRLGIKAP